MCGIAGLVNYVHPVDEQLLDQMTHSLRHRGPDAHGTYVDGRVGLGHRRLSIIDASETANQPLFNEDGTVAVVFNGEIYNFQSLAAELSARGHRFRTRSDTEVIVHAWEEFGPDCLQRFRGMFAMAVYDAGRGELFLARDRLGKKPLYYFQTPAGFAFASEIKALRLLPETCANIDTAALVEYITYGFTLGERTIYSDIHRLPAAHCLRMNLRRDDVSPQISRYWSVRPDPDESLSEDEWVERIDTTLSEAVKLRMISDVPLGAFLSGGIDSSLIVAYMARHSASKVKTFTIGFEQQTHDESKYARAVAAHLGVEHHLEMVEANAIDLLDNIVDAYDEPFADDSAIPTYLLCQTTRRDVTVALSGDGGDESFLGYNRYSRSRIMNLARLAITPPGRALAGMISDRLPRSNRLRRPLQRMAQSRFGLYNHAMGYSCDMLDLLHPEIRSQLSSSDEMKMASDFRDCRGAALLDRYGYTDLMNYLPDDILVKVDRASMHHSLEVRCPLLDHELVELACRIPTRYKLRWGNGKRVLRKLLGRFLPTHLFERPKQGFGPPLASWLRGELREMLHDMISDQGNAMWQYFDRATVADCVRAHQTGRANLQAPLWRAVFFYHWSQRHLQERVAAPCRLLSTIQI